MEKFVKKWNFLFDRVGYNRYTSAARGGIQPTIIHPMKKKIIVRVESEFHAKLKQEAKAEKRKIGDQLLWRALQVAQSHSRVTHQR